MSRCTDGRCEGRAAGRSAPDRLRSGRRAPHPANAEQIAKCFEQIVATLDRPPEQTPIVLLDARDGWRARFESPRGVRAQQIIWSFAPDGRLCRFPDRTFRLALDRVLPEDTVERLVEVFG